MHFREQSPVISAADANSNLVIDGTLILRQPETAPMTQGWGFNV